MRILCVDQATHGGYSIWDYEARKIVKYGQFDFKQDDYNKSIHLIVEYIKELINKYDVSAVIFEDVQFQRNIQTLKKLSRLQGGIIYLLEDMDMLYSIIPPTTWQGYIKLYNDYAKIKNIKKSKELSLNFVKDEFSIDTDNNNVSDAICIGFYAVNNIDIEQKEK